MPGHADKRYLFDLTFEALWVEVINRSRDALRPGALYFTSGSKRFKVQDFGRQHGLPRGYSNGRAGEATAIGSPVERELGTDIHVRAELEVEAGEVFRSSRLVLQARKQPRRTGWGRW